MSTKNLLHLILTNEEYPRIEQALSLLDNSDSGPHIGYLVKNVYNSNTPRVYISHLITYLDDCLDALYLYMIGRMKDGHNGDSDGDLPLLLEMNPSNHQLVNHYRVTFLNRLFSVSKSL